MRVLERENRKAPNQHRCFSGWLEELGNTAPPPLPVRRFHIHSKTACRGFKSFCPCQKSQVSLVRYLTFSLVCGRIWQQGAPAGPPAVRVVGRWSPVATVQRRPRRQPRPSPSAPATKPAETLGFCRFSFFHVLHCYLVHFGSDFWFSHLPAPAAPLSSIRNAPGFAFFWLNRVRFAVFVLF